MSKDNKVNPWFKLVIIIGMFFIVAFLKYLSIDESIKNITFISTNIGFIIYLFYRLRTMTKTQAVLIICILVYYLVFVALVFFQVLPTDNNPFVIIGLILFLPGVVVSTLVYKFIKDFITYYENNKFD